MIAFCEKKRVTLVRDSLQGDLRQIYKLREKFTLTQQIPECIEQLSDPMILKNFAIPDFAMPATCTITLAELEKMEGPLLVAKSGKAGKLNWCLFEPQQGWINDELQILDQIFRIHHPNILKAFSPHTFNWLLLELDVSQVSVAGDLITIDTALLVSIDSPKEEAKVQFGISTKIQMIEAGQQLKSRFLGVEFSSQRYTNDALLSPSPSIPLPVFAEYALTALSQLRIVRDGADNLMRSYVERNFSSLRGKFLENLNSIPVYYLGA